MTKEFLGCYSALQLRKYVLTVPWWKVGGTIFSSKTTIAVFAALIIMI